MASEIHAAALTTFDVDPDGRHVRINVRDTTGQLATLVLPAASANQLLMTLPLMVQTALRRTYGDESLRLVHSLDAFKLEAGELSAERGQQFILTLRTEDGFAVSFAASEDTLSGVARSIFHDIPAYPFRDETVQYRS